MLRDPRKLEPSARSEPSPPGGAGPELTAATKHKTQRRTRIKVKPKVARPWNVIVWDDPVNVTSYVVYVFQKLFGFSLEVATVKMLEVHEQGRSVVATEERERAELYVTRLHGYGLQATMEQVDG